MQLSVDRVPPAPTSLLSAPAPAGITTPSQLPMAASSRTPAAPCLGLYASHVSWAGCMWQVTPWLRGWPGQWNMLRLGRGIILASMPLCFLARDIKERESHQAAVCKHYRLQKQSPKQSSSA